MGNVFNLYLYNIAILYKNFFLFIYTLRDGDYSIMGNIACAAAYKNFCAAMLHDVTGELSEIAARRAELAEIMSASESGTNSAAEAEDRRLEQIEIAIETESKLIEGLLKAAEDLAKNCAKEFKPNFTASA